MVPYTQQILVATGQTDWSSRIEEDGVEKSWGGLVRGLKHMFGRRGKYADVGILFRIDEQLLTERLLCAAI
jgi:hypothetical protein